MRKLSIDEMEAEKGGMLCWAAKTALVVAGLAFTFGTAGWGTLALGFLSLSFAEWGFLESCFPEMME